MDIGYLYLFALRVHIKSFYKNILVNAMQNAKV